MPSNISAKTLTSAPKLKYNKDSMTKTCTHCTKYFVTRGRLCTDASYLECDCPKCQGLCSCLPSAEDMLATAQHEYRLFCTAADTYAKYARTDGDSASALVNRSLKALLEQGKRFGDAFDAYMKLRADAPKTYCDCCGIETFAGLDKDGCSTCTSCSNGCDCAAKETK